MVCDVTVPVTWMCNLHTWPANYSYLSSSIFSAIDFKLGTVTAPDMAWEFLVSFYQLHETFGVYRHDL